MEIIKISKLKKNPANPRTIRDDKFKKLVKSLQDFPEMMELRPVVVNREMIILGGNMRYEAAKAAGWKEIPVTVAELTPEQEREFIIKDNVSGGEWDFDLLANEWNSEELKDWGVDLPDMFGENLEAKDDDYEIPNEIETDIVPGDLFEIGRHRLLCGDATDSDAIARLMNGEKADMVFTDPPYDLKDEYSTGIFLFVKENSHIFIMNSDRNIIDNVNNNLSYFRKFFAVDFRIANLVSNNQPMTRVDLIAEFVVGKTRFKNTHDGFSTLIECAKIHNDKNGSNFGHKQAKKLELPAKFIEHYSDEGDAVLDIFGGSGSTMAAAEQLNRKCYMMELDPKNCQIIIDRMKKCYNLVETKQI